MNFLHLEKTVKADEGFSARPYRDSTGVVTIGYGSTSVLGEPIDPDGPDITRAAATAQLRADLYGALIDCQHLFPRFFELNDVRQEVLVNMAYNLGHWRLSKFRGLIDALDRLDTDAAADHMQYRRPPKIDYTPWFKQTGYRGIRLVNQMRTGER